MTSFCVYGLKTEIIRPGDDLIEHLTGACKVSACGGIKDGDILVIAESAVATAESRVVHLDSITPSSRATDLAQKYNLDPRVAEVVIQESDAVVGGIPGFLLCMKAGTLLPNAGVDMSNTPPGTALPLPKDPDASAKNLRCRLMAEFGVSAGVIIADSRTHAMRLGCSGVAIGCSGIESVIDERGRKDLFGRKLHVTQRAVADCIASAAELLMGEADESMPMAIVRGLALPITNQTGVATIDASECLFMGVALNTNPAIFNNERKAE